MNSRNAALTLTVGGGAVLFLLASESAALGPGLLAAFVALAAIWLASGRTRTVVAVVAVVLWGVALVMGVGGSVLAAVACVLGLAGAVLAVVKGRGWPGWSSRYARTADLDDEGLISPRQMWESLDRGLDPTRRPPEEH
ncbi:MAG: Trp biosynthesis-associated membrane protein [Candidatus Nanopelagicales bacterium]|nr:Trp biosynthesis-associated membrane protein [Candidatus Nanopelagicales bacterium]